MPSNSTRASGVFLSNEKRANNREMGETSFRVYYGATGAAIPFMWESQPGTPKHPIFDKNDNIVPPLTPPPSYLSSSSLSIGHGHGHGHSLFNNKRRKSRIFDIILSSLSRKNSHVTPTSSPSSTLSRSTTSSSSSSISSPSHGGRKNRNKSHRRSISFCSFGAKSPLFSDEEEINSDNNEMCLGFKKKYKGCYSMQDMKNAILSIKGH